MLERRFPSGIDPGQATLIAAELVHDDYAYVFEAHWDLWTPDAVERELGARACDS